MVTNEINWWRTPSGWREGRRKKRVQEEEDER
jgi:hypothetical protein